MPLLTGAEILAFVGNTSPAQGDIDWADAVARAIESGILTRLNGNVWDEVLPDVMYDELRASALIAGAEGYKRKEATFGVTGYADLEGNAIRVAKDYLEGIRPMIDRYSAGPGVA
jgi:hypothetical protein